MKLNYALGASGVIEGQQVDLDLNVKPEEGKNFSLNVKVLGVFQPAKK
jgi:hypothetical protein